MKLSQLGELGLIERIAKKQKKRSSTMIGIGDDCAVIKIRNTKPACRQGRSEIRKKSKLSKTNNENLLLTTTDTLVENVDFKRKGVSFFCLGRKALLANISDISAMGGFPTSALITLGLPKNTEVAIIDEIYCGFDSLAKKLKIDVIGGDTTDSKHIFISIALLGEVEKENLLLRSGAKPGDLICVTGEFGGPAKARYDCKKWPGECRQKEARLIAKSHLANSMIDSSDGLAPSVRAICRASKVGARIWIDHVPVEQGATLDQALYGGEEYELVFTAPQNTIHQLRGVKYSIIGEICRQELKIMLADKIDKLKPLKSGGYEHFK